jgi:hypothetical protein
MDKTVADTLRSANPAYALVTLYLIICGNFLAPLLPCSVQRIFHDNMLAKNLIGFLTMTVFVKLADGSNSTFLELIGWSAVYYLWFILLLRCEGRILAAVIGIFVALYFAEVYKKTKDTSQDILDFISNVTPYLVVTAALLTIAGFGLDLRNKQKRFGRSFNFRTYVLGDSKCTTKKAA